MIATIGTDGKDLLTLAGAVRSLSHQVDKIVICHNPVKLQNEQQYYTNFNGVVCKDAKCEVELVMLEQDLDNCAALAAIFFNPTETIAVCREDVLYHDEYIYHMHKFLFMSDLHGCDVATTGGMIYGEKNSRGKAITYRTPFISTNNLSLLEGFDLDSPFSGSTMLQAKDFQDCSLHPLKLKSPDATLAGWCNEKGLSIKRCVKAGVKLCRPNKRIKNFELWR